MNHADLARGTKSVINCAHFALAKMDELNGNPFINAFLLDTENEVCQVGTMPYKEVRNRYHLNALTNEKSGIYTINKLNYCDLGLEGTEVSLEKVS